MKLFDQRDWSPGEDIISIPELIAERGNFEQFQYIVCGLIEDKEFWQKSSKKCKDRAHGNYGHPERMVGYCEDIYIKVLKEKYSDARKKTFKKIVKIARSSIQYSKWFRRRLLYPFKKLTFKLLGIIFF